MQERTECSEIIKVFRENKETKPKTPSNPGFYTVRN